MHDDKFYGLSSNKVYNTWEITFSYTGRNYLEEKFTLISAVQETVENSVPRTDVFFVRS